MSDEETYPELPSNRGGLLTVGVSLLLLTAAIGGGVYAYYASIDPLDPVRVVVMTGGGIEPGFDRPLLRRFATQLEEHGFDVVTDEEPNPGESDAAIATEAARRATAAEAASAVVLEIRSTEEREGLVANQHLFRSRLVVHVIAAHEDAEPTRDESEFALEGASAILVANGLADTWVNTLAPTAIERLYAVPHLARVIEGQDLAMERMPNVVRLRDNVAMVRSRRQRIDEWDAFVAEGVETVRASAEDGVHCIGDPARPWSLAGLSADGSAAIVHEHYRVPIQPMLLGDRLSWTEPPESVLVVPLEGEAEPRSLVRVGHFYGIAEGSLDGRWVTAAFFGGGVPAVVSVRVEDATWGQRWLLGRRERVGHRETNADGTLLLGSRRREGWALFGGEQPIVMPSFQKATLVETAEGTQVLGQLEDRRLAFVGADGAPLEPWPTIEETVRDFLGVSDGVAYLHTADRGGCYLQELDVAEHTLGERTPLPTCMRYPNRLPDGRLVGAAAISAPGDPPGDLEVVIVDPSDASATPLTRGDTRDELVRVSADGRRIAFSRRIGDWPARYDVQLYRRVVCWLDTPAP